MAAANTKTTLDTMFKYKVASEVNSLIPSCAVMQKMIPKIADSEKLGRKFLWPVALTHENGVTYGDGDAFTYNAAIAGVYDEIEMDSYPVVLRSQVSLSAANRMAGNEQAFITHMSLRSGNMKESLSKRAEIEILHGKTGLGVILSQTGSSTTRALVLTAASWAAGIWGGMEGALLENRDTAFASLNTNTDITIVSVDVATRTINVSGNATDLDAAVATSLLFFKGSYANSFAGIVKQVSNTGTLFGIAGATYQLWVATQHAVGGALTMSQILKGLAKAVGKGGLNEDVCLIVSPATYESLNSDLAALRAFDSSYSSDKAEVGVNSIKYHFQGGALEIVSHMFCKDGEAICFPKKGIKRIGTTDIVFGFGDGDDYFERLEGSAGYQLLAQYDYCTLVTAPAKCVMFTGIVNP